MVYDRFLSMVEDEAGVDREVAERATRAVLQTLAERLSKGQAEDMAAQLPEELARWLQPSDTREKLHADEFLRRVAEREGTDLRTAEQHTKAVFFALGRAVTADEYADMTAELPKDFEALVEPGKRPGTEVMPSDEFIRRVADRAGIPLEQARRATEAVLETLAERIAGGEVRDLMVELPPELHPPLQRGKERVGGVARKMSLEEFLTLDAQREEVPVEVASEHARAVLTTVRDALSDKELSDLLSELPRQYHELLAHP
jgi:uncharacterized protein (DUF2267 family)